MQTSTRGLLFVRMTRLIDRRSAAEPVHYFDKADREVSQSQWEVLRGDADYQQLRITNVTGLRPDRGDVYIRVHTIWTGIGQTCGPLCGGMHLYETRVFDYFDYLPGLKDWHYDLTIPWPWRNAAEAVEGHDAIVREILPRVVLGEAHLAEDLTPTLDLKQLYEQRINARRLAIPDTHSRAAAS